ncbi:glycosyltransferase family 4 protein [Candidatus Daviesbacteria bacterium]|nr:glycosyltransferase family 4 protein [Candidatus Daviesbacteria bacterium]
MKKIKVLLISPADPKKPGNLKFLMGGENTYTQTLLKYPPRDVEYTYYQEALDKKLIQTTFLEKIFSKLMKFKILPPDAGIKTIKLNQKFDLIHCHGYNLHLANDSTPVVLSDSSSNYLFLRDYLGWSRWRIKFGYQIKKALVSFFKIYDQNLNLRENFLIVWSNFAKKIHQSLGIDPKTIFVIPPGVKTPLFKKKVSGKSIHILFIGTWFRRKGGELLVEAYFILKKKYPQLKLTIIGEVDKSLRLPKDVGQKRYISRKDLIRSIYPKADLLVLVPSKAEGYGLVVIEAASFAVPSIVTKIYALPEIVDNNKTGLVIEPGNLDQLVSSLEKLIKNKKLLIKMGTAAKVKFQKLYSVKKTNQKLLQIYRLVLEKR